MGPQDLRSAGPSVQNRERVVSKDDMLEAVWCGRAMSESTLTSHVNTVRKAIGDSGEDQRLIRTVARKGFRFIGETQEEQAPAKPVGLVPEELVDLRPAPRRSGQPTPIRPSECQDQTVAYGSR
jgi:DNA-binding winged helix-turn-helix (wHTH) protein